MQHGKCRLCLEERPLVRSHLLPRGVYDYVRPPDSNPIVISRELVIQSSRQIQDYLLCAPCDNLLSRRGESWVLPLLARVDGAFLFSDILHEQAPDLVDGDTRVYFATKNPKIDVPKLVHFALGIFWKASVHPWRGNRKQNLISLGRYGEPVRLYLLGQGPFPQNMSLTAAVLSQPVTLIAANIPYRGSTREYHNFLFYVSGLYFGLYVGKGISAASRSGCFVANPNHPIIESEFETTLRRVTREVTVNAHVTKSLRDYVATLKNRHDSID